MARAIRGPLAFRFAEFADADNIVDLVNSVYRGDQSRKGWTTEADLLDGQRTDREEVVDVIDSDVQQVLLGEIGGQLVGCCEIEQRPGAVGYLGMLSVQPGVQGSGIGRTIFAEADRIARKELGSAEMCIQVIRQRYQLIAWYERLGYVRTGETIPFPYGNERCGVPKRADLEFVTLTKRLL
jgi:ribosomal protein S18 acetylase RimI-like enzyme